MQKIQLQQEWRPTQASDTPLVLPPRCFQARLPRSLDRADAACAEEVHH
jgi:hypothetical protein